MVWFLKNMVAGFLLFPTNCLLLAALGVSVRSRRPRLGGGLLVVSLVSLAFFSMTGLASRLVEVVETQVPALDLADPGLAARADVIVVPGAGRSIKTQEYSQQDVVSPLGLLRLRYAVELQHRTHKRILVTGGAPDCPGPSEAELMAAALKDDFGVHADWIEGKSANTYENAQFSYRILAPLGIKRIFLVTNAAHMPRALRSFRGAGFEVVPAPMGYQMDQGGGALNWIPSPAGAEMTSTFLHEEIGALWYRLSGAY